MITEENCPEIEVNFQYYDSIKNFFTSNIAQYYNMQNTFFYKLWDYFVKKTKNIYFQILF